MRPKITIVTPGLNQAEFLEEAITSVLSQDYPNLEYIIIDGGSRDDSVEIIKKYQDEITYWVSEPDRGQSHALNKGLTQAQGEIFSFLNADDFLCPGALQAVAEYFAGHPDCDVIYGRCLQVDKNGRALNSHQGRVRGLMEMLAVWDHWFKGEYLISPEVFMRTDAVKSVGGFREEIDLVMDYELWLRLLAHGCRFHAIDAQLAGFRYHDSAKSAQPHQPTTAVIGVVEEYLRRESLPIPPSVRLQLEHELKIFKIQHSLRVANTYRSVIKSLRACLEALLVHPRFLASRLFWSALTSPIRAYF